MYPEKPKNKRKNSEATPRRLLILSLLVCVVSGASVAFAIRQFSTIQLSLNNVQSVTIQNRWSGLSPASPTNADYDLLMQDNALVGSATLSVGYQAEVQTESVNIPPQVVEAFLEKLEEARLMHGVYTPSIQRTDDYPYIFIWIQTASDGIEIYSQSQGEEHRPWGASINGKGYVIDSGIPAEALKLLEPYLKEAELQAMIRDVMGRP